MRTRILVALVLMAAVLAAFLVFRSGADHHGHAFREVPEVPLPSLLAKPGDYLRKEVRIQGEIVRQCPSAGCWFFLKGPEGKELKVEMGDTLPKLPQNLGRTAVVEGQLIPFGDGVEFIGTAVEFR